MLLGTGARIGEVLAIRWESDVDLTTNPATVTISGTVVRLPGKAADGGGLIRQSHPKTDAGYRTVKLPAFARDTLMRLYLNATPTADHLVFPSAAGTLRDPHNVRRQWRDARGEQFAWVTPHSFRKTVATLIDREATTEDAASQLGHSGTAVTRKHYIEKAASAPDLTDLPQPTLRTTRRHPSTARRLCMMHVLRVSELARKARLSNSPNSIVQRQKRMYPLGHAPGVLS